MKLEPATVRTVQSSLNERGFDAGPVDGIFGARTKTALRAFEEQHHLPADGMLDSATYALLTDSSPDTSTGTASGTGASNIGEAIVGGALAGMMEGFGLSTASSPTARRTGTARHRSMAGLEPVGPVHAPGCSGIEVVGYAEQALYRGGDTNYYMALRNNGRGAKFVVVDYIGGVTVLGNQNSGSYNVKVLPGDIQTVHIDYSSNPPKKIDVRKCL